MVAPSPQVPAAAQDGPQQLLLFDDGGLDMAALRRSVESVSAVRRSPRTQHELDSDWALFVNFCSAAGRQPMPSTADTVQLYVAHALATNKVSTVRRRLWAIAAVHRDRGQRSPVNDDVRRLVISAARVKREPVKQAIAITPAVLGRICRAMPATSIGIRDRAMLLLGFGAAMRESEVVQLRLADVTVKRRSGVLVHIRCSKTDQFGRGRSVAVFEGGKPATDPVAAVRSWLQVRGSEPGPLFGSIDRGGAVVGEQLSSEHVCRILQAAMKRAKLDPSGYSGHSLRAGSITAALQKGVPESVVMRQLSGHKSHAMLSRYCRQAELFSVNALAGVL